MRRLLLIIFLTLPSLSFNIPDNEINEIMEVLKMVETNNNPNLIGDGGKAFGVLQIHQACITDVNRYYGTNYTHEDAKKSYIAEDIFNKYISMGIKLYVERCGYYPSDREIVRMWNGGIYRGYEYKSTIPYMKKYIKHKKMLSNE